MWIYVNQSQAFYSPQNSKILLLLRQNNEPMRRQLRPVCLHTVNVPVVFIVLHVCPDRRCLATCLQRGGASHDVQYSADVAEGRQHTAENCPRHSEWRER